MKKQPTLRERALRLLARREHSRAELGRKLAAHVAPGDNLEALLDELTNRKQLSDERYAESRTHVLSRKFGASRIAHELRAKGLSREMAASATGAARANEVERAREVWRRKFKSLPQSREDKARQIRFLLSRGFSFDAVRLILGERLDDN